MMISIPLYTYQPAKFNLVQAIAGVQMWHSDASSKVGLCSVSKNSITFLYNVDYNQGCQVSAVHGLNWFKPCMAQSFLEIYIGINVTI